jgi:hypothetical protein
MKATENTWFSVAFDESTECGRGAYERLDRFRGAVQGLPARLG